MFNSTLIYLALVALLSLVGCGGPADGVVDPSGTWALTDTVRSGSCGPAAVTLVVADRTFHEAGVAYAMTASYCDANFCELQGELNGVTRDLAFYAGGTAGGNRTSGGCFYGTTGKK